MGPLFLFAATTDAWLSPPHWIVTAVYLWLAMLCAWSWREGRGSAARLGSIAWPGLAATFAALAVARPFGLQGRIAEFFRRRAVAGDWYDQRRGFQAWVVLAAVALAVAAAVAIVALAFRRRSPRVAAAFAPVAMLLGFLGVRIVSLHQVDGLLYRRVAGLEVNTSVELALLGLVAAGLVWNAPRARDRAPASVVARDDEAGARRYTIR